MGWLGDFLEWLGELYDRTWPISRWPPEEQPDWFRQGFPVVTLLLVLLLVLFVLADVLGFCSRPEPAPSGGSRPAASAPAGEAVLHVIAYDRPPCTVTPMADITVTPDVDQPTARNSEERPGDAYPGACHWDLPFRKGTKLTWSLRGVAHNGWGTPQSWRAQNSTATYCQGEFKPTLSKPQPTDKETFCSVTMDTDVTLEVTYQTFDYGIIEGRSYFEIAVYPHCLPAYSTANQQPEPTPCVGG